MPGSTPKTLTSSRHRRHRLGVDVEVGKYLRDVVHLLQAFDELQQPLGVAALDFHGVLGNYRDLGALDRQWLRVQRLVDRVELCGRRRDHVEVVFLCMSSVPASSATSIVAS